MFLSQNNGGGPLCGGREHGDWKSGVETETLTGGVRNIGIRGEKR